MGRSLQEAAHNTMEEIRSAKKKKPVSINLDNAVTDYFKQLAEKTSVP